MRLCLKLLGRADNPKNYVRRGCNHAYVETALSGGGEGPDSVVRCDIIKSEEDDTYRTGWALNGELFCLA